MKGFTVALLCFFAVAQALGGDTSTRALAVQGENPWVVHIRKAVATSGLLESCAGSLIHDRWVLTSASCVAHARFIWLRFGVVDVISPSLVIETSIVRSHQSYDWLGNNNIALISVNRAVESSANIRPISIAPATADLPSSANFCGFGENQNGVAGDQLSCLEVNIQPSTGDLHSVVRGESQEGQITKSDIGAPLVSDNVQIGFLIEAGAPGTAEGTFILASQYRDWIELEAGIRLDAGTHSVDAVESVPQAEQVVFVN